MAVVLALLLGVTAGTVFGVVDISVLQTNLAPFAGYIFLGSLGGAYLISERQLGKLDSWEMLSFGAPIAALLLYQFVPEFVTFVEANQPIMGVGLTAISLVAFYILMET
ncbi:hypothetical protein [Methanohalobium sp.]|uniref:hypothetical protein n=1 Tax=Methanohalobium sp. TaxID=2837493 RepID=UPI0025EA230E|nr:hypothetical protein [Methanohalobium sp.]